RPRRRTQGGSSAASEGNKRQGHGSGDIALAFSTRLLGATLPDERLEPLFAAAADATEYAVLDALLSAEGVSGFQQHARAALGPLLDRLAAAN
ncbi:P1 family peptidase, partial [Serratia marcescens]|uniref:P1 family peptidase n=1 Tax=Serratia marcescens TaxID=615 RepID=UPI001F5BBAC2